MSGRQTAASGTATNPIAEQRNDLDCWDAGGEPEGRRDATSDGMLRVADVGVVQLQLKLLMIPGLGMV